MLDAVTFSSPFCYIIDVRLVNSYCYFCLKKLSPSTKNEPNTICLNCKFARFCNSTCREKCKPLHDEECQLLQNVFPNVPHTLILFYSRLVRYLVKNNVKINEELVQDVSCDDRKWAHLMTHMDSIMKDEPKVSTIEILYQLTTQFLRNTYTISKHDFMFLFCKKNINSHGIYNNLGLLLGEAMDFRGSSYDHSCRPTIGISFDGIEMTFRSLIPNIDINDRSVAFVSYTELAQSKYKRRKELMEKYYFHCQCTRCLDPEDDKLVSILCSKNECMEPIMFHEDQPDGPKICPKCQTTVPQNAIENGRTCIELIEKCLKEETVFEKGIELYEYSIKILHPINVYLSDLCTSYLQECLARKVNLPKALDLGVKTIPCLRKCYPKYHKCLAFHLLKLAYIEVYLDDLSNILVYVEESFNILRIWFGNEYYICKKLESLIDKLTAKNGTGNWIVTSDLLKYFNFE